MRLLHPDAVAARVSTAMHVRGVMPVGVVMRVVVPAWASVAAGRVRKSVGHAWVMLHFVPSAMPWNMHSKRCANWLHRPMARH